MTEEKAEALPIDYFASIGIGNRILKLLRDIPFEEARLGGYTETKLKKLLSNYRRQLIARNLVRSTKPAQEEQKSEASGKESKSHGKRSLYEELEALEESCQIEIRREEGEPPRYSLSNNALFYIHSLFPTALNFHTVAERCIKAPSFKWSPRPIGESELLLDEIILVPGSLILAGEHSVLLGQPAIVLPIPLHVMVHATVYQCKKTTEVIKLPPTFPSPNSLIGEISTFPGTPERSRTQDYKFNEQVKSVVDLFQKKLIAFNESSNYYVVLDIRSQIPPSVGLGSSGALCAALAILLDRIKYFGDKSPIDNLNQKDLGNLFDDKKSRLMEIFLNASEFEAVVHGESSGVGPFASLVGDDCFTPLWYDLGVRPDDKVAKGKSRLSQHLNRRNKGAKCTLDLKCKRGSEEARRYLSRYLGLAAVYTTQSRPELKSKQAESSYWHSLGRPDCRRDFFAITQKLWDNLCHVNKESEADDDIQDVITCVNLFGGYEEGYLKMLRQESEATPRELVYHMRGFGLGAKYVGVGFGGDIVVIGRKEKLGMMLFPSYFPVHFSSVNLTDDEKVTPSIDVKARPLIIQKDKFVEELMPQFMKRAQRAYLSY